ncbi:MAG: UDP-N-acetylglucosamine 4,6-dehydratase (inverting) [Candidatus Thiothrix putei]|uniref:UDP-N-acetylglucosamine 4,6-dehydratase (Inverting) n=1 Tax=Candidatus Thiothrix putei TaxID=3080811 RepID=A0AA95HJU1_9GAMM|nr:MAG: UDP-N-acetylglucosamine 4,6-dehydratase (inverting) [Candidatus Thiothrix putei]
MNLSALANKKILITGGTGSVGTALVERILELQPQVRQIIIFSRDEQKQFSMAHRWPSKHYPVRYLLGDVRDRERVMTVMKGCDLVIHSAAMKHVPAAEDNPQECIKTNLIGSQNIIDAALFHQVERVVALSTDKAAQPINAYGASKLLLEKLFVHANLIDDESNTRFSVVRFGNVFGSKGSVIPFFLKQREQGFLPITDAGMTRFSITMRQAVDMVLFTLIESWGGEIVLPVAPSYRITDVATAIAPNAEQRIVGIRPGEKLHELMFTTHDAPRVVRQGNYYIICPEVGCWQLNDYCQTTNAESIPLQQNYDSGENSQWMDIAAIQQLLHEEVMM